MREPCILNSFFKNQGFGNKPGVIEYDEVAEAVHLGQTKAVRHVTGLLCKYLTDIILEHSSNEQILGIN